MPTSPEGMTSAPLALPEARTSATSRTSMTTNSPLLARATASVGVIRAGLALPGRRKLNIIHLCSGLIFK